MTDSEYIATQLNTAQEASSTPRWSILLTALALVLALVIGLSAVDIQDKRFGPATQNAADQHNDPQLDGRGKWGGYLK
ncbi:MAG: hypothetical protein ABJN26_08420 [Stappiaceae bacterium]